jgi:UDP-N-acetylmuramate-alanine ligase
MPNNGKIVACLDGANVQEVLSSASCPIVTYSVHKSSADYSVENVQYSDLTRFVVKGEEVVSPLMGEHNVQNTLGCLAVSHIAGISTLDFSESLQTFKGINRRLEVRGVYNGISVIDDHAHSPIKARASLEALRTRYPNSRIIAVFDPSYSALRERDSLVWYPGMFDIASEVIVTKMPRVKGVTSDERVLGIEIVSAIRETQGNVQYMPIDEKVLNYLVNSTSSGDVIIFMSSAGFRGLIDLTVEKLNEH